MIIYGLILFCLLIFFKGAEIALLSTNRLNIELGRSEYKKRGNIIAKMMDQPRLFLGSILLGGNTTLVVFTGFLAYILYFSIVPYVSNPILLTLLLVGIISTIVSVFGEFLPKILVNIFSEKFLYLFALPILITYYLFNIPVRIMYFFSDLFVKSEPKELDDDENPVFSREDLEEFVTKSNKKSDKDETIDTTLFFNALKLKEIKVRDCMVPRTELISIPIDSSIDELVRLFKKTNLSRILVDGDDHDNIVGYVHHQQLLHSPNSIGPMVMEINFVPETYNAYDMLDFFVKGKSNIAVVVDEFGGTSGVITMEDILEQLFGNIEDEHDVEHVYMEQVDQSEYLISGRAKLEEINKAFPLLELNEEVCNTLSGYIVTQTQNIPRQGDQIVLDKLKFVIESESETKIEMVRIFTTN